MAKKSWFVAILLASAIGGIGCGAAREALKQVASGAAASSEKNSYFIDATSIPAKFQARLGGPVRILEITVYPSTVKSKIQNPRMRFKVDAYELKNGRIGTSIPVKFVGNQPSQKDLDEVTFDISSIDFTQVTKMAKDAPAQLKLRQGKVTHMILKRTLPFSNDVVWRIYVSDERQNGSVEYSLDGNVLRLINRATKAPRRIAADDGTNNRNGRYQSELVVDGCSSASIRDRRIEIQG